jgi:hypothetical protein
MDLEVERIFGLSLVAPSMDMRTKERYAARHEVL